MLIRKILIMLLFFINLCEIYTPAKVPRRQSANMTSTVNQTVTCLLCKESTGTKLKLWENSVEAMEHYKVCLYNQGLLQMLVDAGRENLDENNQVLDPYGKKFLYKCGCKTEIKMRGRPSPSHMSYKVCCFKWIRVHGYIGFLAW